MNNRFLLIFTELRYISVVATLYVIAQPETVTTVNPPKREIKSLFSGILTGGALAKALPRVANGKTDTYIPLLQLIGCMHKA